MPEAVSLGQAIADARKKKDISQKRLAELIKREDGEAISPQYLNDIEHDRRSPSSNSLVTQFANVLELDAEHLMYLAGKYPAEILDKNYTPDQIKQGLTAFRQAVKTSKKR